MDVDSESDSQGSSDESEIPSSASSSTEEVYNAVDQGISQNDLSLKWLLDKIQQDHEMHNASALHALHK